MRQILLFSAALAGISALAVSVPMQLQKKTQNTPAEIAIGTPAKAELSKRAMKTPKTAPRLNNILNPEMRKNRRNLTNKEGFILFEDFEAWDSSDANWLPEGWTVDHKNSPASNRGWKMTQPYWDPDYIDSKCVTYELFIAEDGEPCPSVDEWIITPEFPVAEGMELTYETMTSPYYYDWSYMDDSYRLSEYVILNDLKVNVSDDGGKTWTELFSHAQDLIEETNGNFFAMFNYNMRPFTLSLDNYAGKNVKIGFQIVGTEFNTSFIDNVSVGLPPTQTSYTRQVSNLYFGLTDMDNYVPASLMIGPVYSPVTYTNTTKTKNAEFLWTYEAVPGETSTSTDKNLTVTYKTDYTDAFSTRNNLYPFPVLEGSSAATSPDEFTYQGFYQAGGRGEYEIHYVDTDEYEVLQLGMTVADPRTEGTATWADIAVPYFGYNNQSDRFWSEYTFGEDYVPGGNNWHHLEKIADFFYTPGVPIVIEGIRLNAFGKIKRTANFTADIYLLSAGYVIPDEPAYTATCTGNDITIIDRNSTNDFISLNFKFDQPVVISKAEAPYFLVAIGGFRDEKNVEYFSPEMSAVSNPNNLGLGWIGSQMCWEGSMLPFSWSAVANYTGDEFVSFYIMLDGIFPWLEAETEQIDIVAGETATLELDSYYDGSNLKFEGMPTWLFASAEGRYDKTVVTFKTLNWYAEQSADITITAPGVSKKVHISCDVSGINDINADNDGPVRYFNLQGVEIDNPGTGIYIRVKGNKTEKVIRN